MAAALLLVSARPTRSLFGQAPRAESALAAGDSFPRLTGEALSGRPIAIPSSGTRKPTIVLFSFSKSGGDDARLWNERLEHDIDSTRRPDIRLVLEMQKVPRLIRGPIIFGIKRGVPPALRDRMLVLNTDAALWQQRLLATTTDRSYVVLIAPRGRIRWMSGDAYGEEEYKRLRAALSALGM